MTKIDYIDPFINVSAVQARMAEIEEPKMLSLTDINAATNSYDGDVYSDLYKDVYGIRPRTAAFKSVEEFDADFKLLISQLNEQQAEEEIRQAANLEKFASRVRETMELCNCDAERAVEIIADAEGELDSYQWYGYERLEWHFNLKYGSIKTLMKENVQ